MSSNDETGPIHTGRKEIVLACGNSVTLVRQVATKISGFSTHYIPCVDEDRPDHSYELPYDTEFGRIFCFPTTINRCFYIPRTHGHWWSLVPSGFKEDFMPQNNDLKVGHDFVDFIFEKEVYPLRIIIFEAFNPGCIIKIWAENFETKLWHKIWSGPVRLRTDTWDNIHRIFCPSFEICNFRTKLLRLELSHSHLEYYTQVEGVFLMGTREFIVPLDESDEPYLATLYHDVRVSTDYHEYRENDRLNRQILAHDLSKLKETMRKNWRKSSNSWEFTRFWPTKRENDDESEQRRSLLEALPDETMLNILRHLDLQSLCRCSQVNKRLNFVTRDASLYASLNLKPYWNLVDVTVLKYLTPRCKYLRRLDLSWCGNYDNSMIPPQAMVQFIEDCGQLLTNLRLDCCQFVNDAVLFKIASCRDLKELCLNNCRKITDCGLEHLAKLQSLERFEIYRIKIKTGESLRRVIEANRQLRHLNLAEIENLDMNFVAWLVADCCPKLESIDCWNSRSLTTDGVRSFAQCTNLREIDLGYCEGVYIGQFVPIQEDAIHELFSVCKSLEKVGLTALPGLHGMQLEPLLSNPKLKQLHLAGAEFIYPTFLCELLSSCTQLRMLDIHGYHPDDLDIETVRNTRPGVLVKWTFSSFKYYHRRMEPPYPTTDHSDFFDTDDG